jgi:hypothetical protein
VSRNISISRSLKGAASALLFLRFDGIFDPADPTLIPLSALEGAINETTGSLTDSQQISQLVMEEFYFHPHPD